MSNTTRETPEALEVSESEKEIEKETIERKIKWIGTTTDFIELGYALYETKAAICIGQRQSKDLFIKNLGNYFGVKNIDKHASKHSKHISNKTVGRFLHYLYQKYVNYVNRLHNKDGIKSPKP